MPELPEVETIKLFLARNIVGAKIKSVEVLNPKSFIGDLNLLIGKQIKSVERRAKILRLGFGDFEFLIHLKMSGQLVLIKGEAGRVKGEDFMGGHPTKDMHLDMPNKSTRVIFELENLTPHPKRYTLYFNDQRKFGWIRLVGHASSVRGHEFFDKLGPEPLEKEFTWKILKENLLRRKKTPVKVALLDQQIVAGVGNIYACEACFLAGISPVKKIGELENKDYQRLHKGIKDSLQNGIKYGGSSKTHFISPEGKKGLFLDFAYVYGRAKLPCKKCTTPIKKIKLGGRGTYLCTVCQIG